METQTTEAMADKRPSDSVCFGNCFSTTDGRSYVVLWASKHREEYECLNLATKTKKIITFEQIDRGVESGFITVFDPPFEK